MPEYQLDLDQPVAGAHLAELRRRVYFLSEAVVDFRLVTSGDTVTAVVATTDRPVVADDLARRLRYVVDNEVRVQLPTPPKVLWRSPSDRKPGQDVFDRLVADGLAHEIGPGQVALGGPAIAALEAVDSLLRAIVVGEFGAREYRYPTLLPVSALHRSGYLSSFPQHLMFAARLDGELDNYREFTRDAAAHQAIGDRVLSRCAPVDRCLPPTMCYHTFDQFASSTVDDLLVVTAKGGSFRHESRYHRTLERLADFTIRETVFVGAAKAVRQARDRLRERAVALVTELDLAGRCEVANDPFFAGAEGAAKVSSQRLLELKHELHLDIADGESIAVGSFNLHEQHFTEAFDIRDSAGGHVYSSCVGFGLERLTYAVLCQYGWDVRDWPALLREHPAVVALPGRKIEGNG